MQTLACDQGAYITRIGKRVIAEQLVRDGEEHEDAMSGDEDEQDHG